MSKAKHGKQQKNVTQGPPFPAHPAGPVEFGLDAYVASFAHGALEGPTDKSRKGAIDALQRLFDSAVWDFAPAGLPREVLVSNVLSGMPFSQALRGWLALCPFPSLAEGGLEAVIMQIELSVCRSAGLRPIAAPSTHKGALNVLSAHLNQFLEMHFMRLLTERQWGNVRDTSAEVMLGANKARGVIKNFFGAAEGKNVNDLYCESDKITDAIKAVVEETRKKLEAVQAAPKAQSGGPPADAASDDGVIVSPPAGAGSD